MKLYVVSDNAANVKAACHSLPDQFEYYPCFTHILQLVIKDSTKEIVGYTNIKKKVKILSAIFTAVQNLLQCFKKCKSI